MKKYLFTFSISIFFLTSYAQKKFCADSSIRIKYSAQPFTMEIYANPDTSGFNFISGNYHNPSFTEFGLIMAKSSWGDSLFWSKKYFSTGNIQIRVQNSFKGPGNIVILSGDYRNGNIRDFLLSRMDTIGNLIWTRRFPFISGTISYIQSSNYTNKNIVVTNSAIYFIINSSPYIIVGKLDFNGNLLWSKNFISLPYFSSFAAEGLVIENGVIYFGASKIKATNTGITNYYGLILTGLDESTGNLISSELLSILPDNFAKGIYTRNIHSNNDGTSTFIGEICTFLNALNPPTGPSFKTKFSLQLDRNFNTVRGSYFKTVVPPDQTFQFDINNQKEYAFLYGPTNPLEPKYFLSYDSLNNLLRCRKFSMPAHVGLTHSDVYLDDKDNLHYFYNYVYNGQPFSEYARISDLAPANTLQCFGEDTAGIFQQFPMQITKESFTWDIVQNNVLSSLPVTVYTENFPINKEVVCKQVSYCDSLKILGNPTVCIGPGNARFSSFLNPQCLKSLNWKFDTSYASLVNYEADSAITLSFKKTGSFYLKAEVNNCIVNDSILITITQPQSTLQLNKKDSLLCPGGSVVLQANPGFQSYRWQDGSTNSSYNVTAPGLYRVTATDSCGNIFSDSMRVNAADTSLNISTSYTICPYDSAKLLLPANATNITWQPAASGLLFGNTLSLFPPQTTLYRLQAQIPPGCDVQKNITVVKGDCPEWVRFPSAFTPNGDGLNDFFKPGISGTLQSYNLKIFNRSGQLIVNSNNPFEGWDGTVKGKKQNSGVFVFLCRYRFTSGETKMEKGTVMLIR